MFLQSGARASFAASGQILCVVQRPLTLLCAENVSSDNNKRYGSQSSQQNQSHRRSASISHNLEGLHPGPELSGLIRPIGTPNVVEADVFPPSRSQAPDPSIFLPYITEDIAFEEEYEEYLSDLGWTDDGAKDGHAPLFGGASSQSHSQSAWHRLPEFVAGITDGISDSESVASIGDIGDEPRLEGGDIPDENLNNWEASAFLPPCPPRADSTAAHEPAHDGRAAQVACQPAVELGRGPAAGGAVWPGRRERRRRRRRGNRAGPCAAGAVGAVRVRCGCG